MTFNVHYTEADEKKKYHLNSKFPSETYIHKSYH